MKKRRTLYFYLQHVSFLKLFFVMTFVLLNLLAPAQGKFTGDADDLNRRLKLKKLPAISVWDKNGSKHDLDEYINKNQPNSGKPVMLIAFGMEGDYSADEITEVAKSTIPDEYNVIVLCAGNRAQVDKGIRTIIQKVWPKLMVVNFLWDDLNKFYKDGWPFSVFADKDKNVLYFDDGWIKPVKQVAFVLEQIKNKKFSTEQQWFNKKGEMTSSNDPEAYYFTELKATGNRITDMQGTKEKKLYSISYIYKDDNYYYDGVAEASTDTGQPLFSGKFKEGVALSTVMGWYRDGKIRFNIPFNGTAKSFNANGKLTMEGDMKNGLGDGLFTFYTSDSTKETFVFKNGEKNGLSVRYKKDKIECERILSPLYEDNYPYDCFEDGLQLVKTKAGLYGFINKEGKVIIPVKYKYAANFYGKGLAKVSMQPKNENSLYGDPDSLGLIDKTGKEVLPLFHWKLDIHDDVIIAASRKENNMFGATDKNGKVILPFIYEDIKYLTPELFIAKKGKTQENGTYTPGYDVINKKGDIIIPVNGYSSSGIELLSDNLILVDKGKDFLYNSQGKSLYPDGFGNVSGFNGSKLAVVKNNYLYGFIDKDGKLIVPLIYDEANSVTEGLALVGKHDNNGKYINSNLYGYIDEGGKEVITIKYKNAYNFKNGKAKVSLDGFTYFYIDKTGRKTD